MAMISLIAAILIGGGDAFKLLKVWAKPSERIAVALLKEGGSKVAAKELSELSAKESGGVLKLLTYIFGNIGGVLGKATTMVGILIKKFGNITKWVPGLGGMLKWVFDLMGDTLTKFGNMVSLGSANLKLATAAAKKSAAMSIDSAVKAGGDFVVDGSWIKVIGKDGKTLGRYPAKQFDKISAESLANLATKKAGEKEAAKILYKNGDDLADVSRVLTDPKVQLSTRKAIYKFFGTTPFEAGFKRALGKRLYYFIGKTIYALIFGTDWVEGGQNKWSKREVEGHGNGAMNAWIADRIKKQRAESGATYIPAVMLDSRDQEVYDQITDYQNHFAKELDQPTIMQVVTNKYDKQETPDEVADFFKQIEEGEVTRGGEGDRVSHEDADSTSTIQRMEESRKPLVRKILNFSDFNNGTKGL
jgi:hypothetical protein